MISMTVIRSSLVLPSWRKLPAGAEDEAQDEDEGKLGLLKAKHNETITAADSNDMLGIWLDLGSTDHPDKVQQPSDVPHVNNDERTV